MIIDGFNKLTLLDYPDVVSCIIFTRGCNFKCSYCHNYSLVDSNQNIGTFTEEEVLEYLNLRKNVIKGIVISGGEPTIQKNLSEFLRKIKNIGYLVKLDTNGSNPEVLRKLIQSKLVNYVAMDIKNSFEKYEEIICKKTNIDNIKESIKILRESNIDYEFRTTLVKEHIKLKDLENILTYIEDSKYYIQNFKLSDGVYDKKLHGYSEEEILNMVTYLKIINSNIEIR